MTISQNTHLSLLGITGAFPAADIEASFCRAGGGSPPPPANGGRLPEGWHDTEKYGPVFVSPSGTAWGVKIIGTRLENVVVNVSPRDFIGKTAIEKRKQAIVKQTRRAKSKVSRTTPPILTPQRETSTANGVSEASA